MVGPDPNHKNVDVDWFTFGPVPPTVTSISPASGLEAGGTSVQVTGTQFTPGVDGLTI